MLKINHFIDLKIMIYADIVWDKNGPFSIFGFIIVLDLDQTMPNVKLVQTTFKRLYSVFNFHVD